MHQTLSTLLQRLNKWANPLGSGFEVIAPLALMWHQKALSSGPVLCKLHSWSHFLSCTLNGCQWRVEKCSERTFEKPPDAISRVFGQRSHHLRVDGWESLRHVTYYWHIRHNLFVCCAALTNFTYQLWHLLKTITVLYVVNTRGGQL